MKCNSLHHMPENWREVKVTLFGRVRVECKECGALIGYRPEQRTAGGNQGDRSSRKRN